MRQSLGVEFPIIEVLGCVAGFEESNHFADFPGQRSFWDRNMGVYEFIIREYLAMNNKIEMALPWLKMTFGVL